MIMNMMSGNHQRDLDVTNSSTDVAALNNVVVSMRKSVKGAKIHTIRKLTKSIHALKKKKVSEDQQEKTNQKIERLLKEILFIKRVKPDKVSKFALAKTDTFDEICKKHPDAIENRALARLSENKYLCDQVGRFREAHDDWKELAAFILSKNTGRRFRKTPGAEVQRDVENVLLESQQELQRKKGTTEVSAEEAESSGNESGEPDDGGEDSESSHGSETESKDVDEKCAPPEIPQGKDIQSKISKKPKVGNKSRGVKEMDSRVKDTSEMDVSTHRKEMAIQRLDLDKIAEGEIVVQNESDPTPSFLLSKSDDVKKQETKPKSRFFMCDSDSGDDDDDNAAEEDDEANDGPADDADLQEKNRMRARDAINSTFLGSLSSAGRKHLEKREHRNVNDYQRKRQGNSQPGQYRSHMPTKHSRQTTRQPQSAKFNRKNTVDQPGNYKDKKQTKTAAPPSSEDKELHPSWEASKKRKQQQTQLQPFQGKKIKFDDD